MNAERSAKPASTPKAGFFATLFALLRGQGTPAPAGFRAPAPNQARRAGGYPPVLCGVALVFALLALTAAPALAANPPALTIAAPSAITYHSAQLEGTVNPEGETGSEPTTWSFELSADGGATWNPVKPEPHQIGAPASEEANPVLVEDEATELTPGHSYLVRLTATNATGPSTSAEEAFETEAVAAPSASALVVSALTASSAHFEATVNAGGTGPGESTATYAFSCEPACPGLAGPAPIPADGSPHTVEVTATNLEPNTPYTVTITATSPGGQSKAEAPFTTKAPAPDVATLPFVGPVSPEAARLYGTVNPHNSLTTYFFEYGPTTSYGSVIPLTKDAPVPPGNTTQTVGQDVSGLSPSTTYHYRIVVKSGAEEAKGADQILSTAAAPPACSAAEQQLRTENNSTALPDCRAYEQVSPAFKAGALQGINAISSDGSRLIAPSVAVLGGTEGYGQVAEAIYESVRSTSGWATRAISPPLSLYSAQELVDASPDLGRSLWALRHPSQSPAAEDLYLREPGGSFVKIGPMLPPSATEGPPAEQLPVFTDFRFLIYNGASRDLSHVFFQMEGNGPTWPGDTTLPELGPLSLYEYVGTANTEPELVGVSDGHTVVNGETLPAGRLISDCGVALGSIQRPFSGNADTYNAISADGETVFFTADSAACGASHAPEVNEVYARLGQGEAAQTVPISEPTHADCEACQTTTRANAEFQGASQDGTKVFFLTEAELFPGDKGNNLYQYDFAGEAGERIVPVSTSTGVEEPAVQGVARVSEDGSHVYFVAHGVLTEGSNAEGRSPSEGADNLYLFERDATHPEGQLTFLATLSDADGEDWQGADFRPAQATPDGRFLVFQSVADLTPGDASSLTQVFEYDALREELVRISVGEAGYAEGMQSAELSESSITVQGGHSQNAAVSASTIRSALSSDGSTVVFQSRGGLTRASRAAGEAGRQSIYRYRSQGILANGDVSSLSTGSGSFESRLSGGIDASGKDVFFEAQAPILASDRDTQWDQYDAREAGGFPIPPVASSCAGEGCQGTPSSTPAESSPATPGFQGPGNAEEKPCKKGFIKKRGKCIKRHTKKHHPKKHKPSNASRRVSQ